MKSWRATLLKILFKSSSSGRSRRWETMRYARSRRCPWRIGTVSMKWYIKSWTSILLNSCLRPLRWTKHITMRSTSRWRNKNMSTWRICIRWIPQNSLNSTFVQCARTMCTVCRTCHQGYAARDADALILT